MARQGPFLRITATCSGCDFNRTESYRVQGDSGHDVYCDHPTEPGKRVADSRWETPDWCPLGETMLKMRAILEKQP